MTKPAKKWKSLDDQIKILKSRGMIIDDSDQARDFLQRVGYYRLSGYSYPFRKMDSNGKRLDDFAEDSKFDDVIQLYIFDRRLKLLAMDAIERIELAVQVDIAHLLGRRDSFAHHEPKFLDGKFVNTNGSFGYQDWLEKYHSLVKRSKASFVEHNLKSYGKLPIWVAIEVWDFGALSLFFSGMKGKDKIEISKKYGLKNDQAITSWLRSLNYIRNVSAHHSRLWNSNIVERASTKGLSSPLKEQKNERSFLYFCIMKQMLDMICPHSSWGYRFRQLIDQFPEPENKTVSLEAMGIAEGWEKWEIWK